MSQQKVDKYKQDKANRSQIMKKQKFTRRFQFIIVIAIVAAALVWFGVSVYNSTKQSEETGAVYIDSEDVVSYMNDPASWAPEEEAAEETGESVDVTEETGESVDATEETVENSDAAGESGEETVEEK